MAELAENLLSKIQSEAEAHNTALAALLKQSADQFAETQSMQLSSDRAAAAVEEYSAQQQGQEIAFSRTQQHLQQKTEAAIEKQSLTDTPGLLGDSDIVSVMQSDDQPPIRVHTIQTSEIEQIEEEKQTIQNRIAQILEDMKDTSIGTLGSTVQGWAQSGKDRITELASFDKFKGALKTDLNLVMGKLQLLTQLPGVTSILQAIKFSLASLVTWFMKGMFGKDIMQGNEKFLRMVEDMQIKFLGADPKAVKKARQLRDEKRALEGIEGEEEGRKDASGKVWDKDSPQAKMIAKWQTSRFERIKNQMGAMYQNWYDGLGNTNKMIMDKVFAPIGKAFAWAGTMMLTTSKKFMKTMKKFFVQVAIFLGGIAMAIGSFILANLPIIAIVAAIALVIFGIMWLVAYVIDSWEGIKIKFNEAWDIAMMKWENFSFSEWVDNAFQSFVLSVRNLWWSIASGIEGFINDAITWYNSKMPGDVFDIDWRADFGAGAKLEEVKKEQSALSAKKNEKAEDIAAKEKEIRDRYDEQRIAAGIAPTQTTVQQNTVSNTNRSEKNVIGSTRPVDAFATSMNQPTY